MARCWSLWGRSFCIMLLAACMLVCVVSPAAGQVTLGEPPRPRQPHAIDASSVQPAAIVAATAFVAISSRTTSKNLFKTEYNISGPAHPSWTGKLSPCSAGTTSAAFKASVVRRINYFRTMAGVPHVTLNSLQSSKAQQAALIMMASNTLSHTPDSSFKCYTSVGKEAAGSSNLALGAFGRQAIDMYMNDYGVDSAGHRFWVICPYTRTMGTGDTAYKFDPYQPNGCCKQTANSCPGSTKACGPYSFWRGSNTLWVFPSGPQWSQRPATRQPYVAWPPPGYVPYQFIYDKWTFAYPDADFASASVTMTRNGVALPVAAKYPGGWYGDQTMVWRISGSSQKGQVFPQPPAKDVAFRVTLRNVRVNGVAKTFSYTVFAFNPAK